LNFSCETFISLLEDPTRPHGASLTGTVLSAFATRRNPVSAIRRQPREEHSTFADFFRDLLAGFKSKQPFPALGLPESFPTQASASLPSPKELSLPCGNACVPLSQNVAASRLQPDRFLRRTEVMILVAVPHLLFTASALPGFRPVHLAKRDDYDFHHSRSIRRSLRRLQLAAKRFRSAPADR
jgi:hypothetical protein